MPKIDIHVHHTLEGNDNPICTQGRHRPRRERKTARDTLLVQYYPTNLTGPGNEIRWIEAISAWAQGQTPTPTFATT